jgi:hypothetical protein
MAQLVARLHGMQKVRGSNPLSSTRLPYFCSILVEVLLPSTSLKVSLRRLAPELTAELAIEHRHQRSAVKRAVIRLVTRVVHVPYAVEQDALEALLEVVGPPDELTLTLNVALFLVVSALCRALSRPCRERR